MNTRPGPPAQRDNKLQHYRGVWEGGVEGEREIIRKFVSSDPNDFFHTGTEKRKSPQRDNKQSDPILLLFLLLLRIFISSLQEIRLVSSLELLFSSPFPSPSITTVWLLLSSKRMKDFKRLRLRYIIHFVSILSFLVTNSHSSSSSSSSITCEKFTF